MENNTNGVKQNKVKSLVMSGFGLMKIEKFRTIVKAVNPKIAIIVLVIVVVGVFAYFYRGLYIAATVNGSPISRLTVISKLEKAYGKEILNSLITRKLIISELDNKKIIATNDEIDTAIKNIEDRIVAQNGTLAQSLAEQSMTMADLRDQISINLRMEKFLADKTQVSDDEINQYIKDNKLTIPKGQEATFKDQVLSQLKSDKFDKAAQDWVGSINSQASIKYFGNY